MAASFCVSIDLEMGWGIWDIPDPTYFRACARKERHVVASLVRLLEEFDASATWAIVGRLLDKGDGALESRHGFDVWFAPDVVEIVRGARTAQDIGSHGYAHRYFGSTPREQLAQDLAAAKRVHDAAGLPFESFVFPRNDVDHVDLLRSVGVKVFRSVDVGWHVRARRLGASVGRLANLVDKLLPLPAPLVRPKSHGELVELPSSMLFMARDGLRRIIPSRTTVAKAQLGLGAAVREQATFHLWFHPSNFYVDTERQLAALRAIISDAARRRDAGELEILPMKAFARAA